MPGSPSSPLTTTYLGSPPARLPLDRGRKEGAATSLEARGLHGLDQLERRTVEGAGERPVRAADERVVQVFRIHRAAPSHEHAFLALPERVLGGRREVAPRLIGPDDAAETGCREARVIPREPLE